MSGLIPQTRHRRTMVLLAEMNFENPYGTHKTFSTDEIPSYINVFNHACSLPLFNFSDNL